MSVRQYFPNLREPVVVWLIFLIGIFYATIALLLVVTYVNETRRERCDLQIEHQLHRKAIGSVIQHKLLMADHLSHYLADVDADDEHKLDVLRSKLAQEIDGIDAEMVELTPGIGDLSVRVDELSRVMHERLSATTEEEKNSLDKVVASRLKTVSATISHARNRVNQICFDTDRQLSWLEAERAKTTTRLLSGRYMTIAASVLLVALVGGLILVRVSQNLADRDRAAAKLQRSKQTTQTILQKLPLGVAVIGRDKIIRYVNDTVMSMAGYSSSDELVGRLCHTTLCPAQADRCPILQLGQSLDNSERVLRTVDNRKIPILKTVIPVTLDDEEVLLETFIDISERKKVEKLLQDYAKELEATNLALEKSNCAAQEASRAKSEFLANMSHELRTPLHGILSFATFGRKKAKTADPDQLQNYFEKIDSSGETLLHLVNDLLDLSKLEAGKMILELEETDVSMIMCYVTDEFSSRVEHQSITIKYEKSEVDTKIVADRKRLEQVIRNLLSNAIKFSPQGSTIEIRMEVKNESMRVSVLDQGVGIPEGELDKIFDKFIQSSLTRTGAGGTGLGLSICQEIIECHKGRIWAENRAEGGAVLRFEIPLDACTSNTCKQNPQLTGQVVDSTD